VMSHEELPPRRREVQAEKFFVPDLDPPLPSLSLLSLESNMDNLKCNRLSCRSVLLDTAVVTTCSHCFCGTRPTRRLRASDAICNSKLCKRVV
jgi:hypothetical protein